MQRCWHCLESCLAFTYDTLGNSHLGLHDFSGVICLSADAVETLHGVPRLCGLCSLSHCDLGGEIFPDRTVSSSDFAGVCAADYCTKPQSWAFDFTGGSVCLLSCFDLYDDSIVCGAVWSVVFIPEKAGICRFDAGNDSAVSGKLFCNAACAAVLHHEQLSGFVCGRHYGL